MAEYVTLSGRVVGCGLLAASLACTPETEPPPAPSPIEELSSADQLMRASMALRGLRPSLEDYDAVAADPDALDAERLLARLCEPPQRLRERGRRVDPVGAADAAEQPADRLLH